MGEWKAQISLRVRQDLRREMEEFADKERRKLGNVGEVLLEWAWAQLQVAGSIDRLLKFKIRSKNRFSSLLLAMLQHLFQSGLVSRRHLLSG
jgi:hypothetical protein